MSSPLSAPAASTTGRIPNPVTANLSVRVYRGLPGLTELRPHWLDLAAWMKIRLHHHNFAWYWAMAETFEALKKGDLFCIAVFDHDRLILVMPLQVVSLEQKKKKWPGLQLLSNPSGTQSMRDFLVDDAWRETPLLGELIRFLARTDSSWDVLSLRGITWNSCAYTMLQSSSGLKFIKTPGGPWGRIDFLSCGKDHNPFARLSKSFRQNLRTSHNKIGAEDLKFEQTNDPRELPAFFEEFAKIEASGWKGERGTSVQHLPAQRVFLQNVMRHFGPQGGCEIHLMKIKDEPVAAMFCVIENNTLFLARTAYLESMHLLSPGHLIFEQLLKTRGVQGTLEMITPNGSPSWFRSWRPDTLLGISNVFVRRSENRGGKQDGQFTFTMTPGTGPLIEKPAFNGNVPSVSMNRFPVRIDPRVDSIGIFNIGWVGSRVQFFSSTPGIRAIRLRGFVPHDETFKDQRYTVSYRDKVGAEKPLPAGPFKITIPWNPECPEITLQFTLERRRTPDDDHTVSCQLKSVELIDDAGFSTAIKDRLRALEMGFRQGRKKLRHRVALFFQTELFDLLHGTDTHVVVPKTEYAERPSTFDSGTPYNASWTSEVKKSFTFAQEKLGADFPSYTFIDLGCGKGKAVLAWKLLLKRKGIQQEAVGLDYSDSLIEVARANDRKMFGEGGRYFIADASTFDYAGLNEKLIIYMFNPFDEVILQKVLDSIKGLKTLLIYCNPNHESLVGRNGWKEIHRREGFLGFNRTRIYVRNID